MKRFVCLLLVSMMGMGTSVWAQGRNATYDAYIEKYKDIAIREMHKYHIPASITMAQGLLESGAGKAPLALRSNNHFGIKCGSNWYGATTRHDDDYKQECFRVYDTVEQSYEDHSLFLQKPRYSRLFQLKQDDYKGWAQGLKACGYATSPTYAQRLIELIERYQLHLLDHQTLADTRHDKADERNKRSNDEEKYRNDTPQTTTRQFHVIQQNNNTLCVIAQPGDTWESLSKDLKKSKRHLMKVNEADNDMVIKPNTFVYLEKKQKLADKKYKKYWHVVKPGESMHSISQYYGIRIKSLYHLNFKDETYIPRAGELLIVR